MDMYQIRLKFAVVCGAGINLISFTVRISPGMSGRRLMTLSADRRKLTGRSLTEFIEIIDFDF